MRVRVVSQGRCSEDREWGHGAQMDGWGESLWGPHEPLAMPCMSRMEKAADGVNILSVSS